MRSVQTMAIVACVGASVAVVRPASAQESNLYALGETIAFEDVQAGSSDADQNDVAVRTNRRCRVDGSGLLVKEITHLTMLSAGATLDNALRLQVLGAPDTVTVSVDGGSPVAATPDAAGWIEIFSDVRQGFAGAPTGFVNTEGTVVDGLPVTVEATHAAGPDLGGTCPPVQLAVTRPGVTIDASSTLDANQQPMMARLPLDFDVPEERVALGDAYPDFLVWLADRVDNDCSPGSCAQEDWYTNPTPEQVFPRPSRDVTAYLPASARASCSDVLADGDTASGTYAIDPDGAGGAAPFDVYCDQELGSGGWMAVFNYQDPQDESTTAADAFYAAITSWSSMTAPADPASHTTSFQTANLDLDRYTEALYGWVPVGGTSPTRYGTYTRSTGLAGECYLDVDCGQDAPVATFDLYPEGTSLAVGTGKSTNPPHRGLGYDSQQGLWGWDRGNTSYGHWCNWAPHTGDLYAGNTAAIQDHGWRYVVYIR